MAVSSHSSTWEARYDDYWKLKTYAGWTLSKLRDSLKSGHHVPKSITKNRLIAIKHVQDCGRMGYDDCAHHELLTIAASRHIPLTATSETTAIWRRIIRTLTQADDGRTFKRFMNLPSELSGIVHEYYLLTLPDDLTLPSQRPLGRVSRTLRNELLPKIYSSKMFHLEFEHNFKG